MMISRMLKNVNTAKQEMAVWRASILVAQMMGANLGCQHHKLY